MVVKVLILDQDFTLKTTEIIGTEYSVKRKPRRTTMSIIKKWLEKIKNFLTPKKKTPIKRKPRVQKKAK
tara:strand:+ start:97 stop:303 length:207 start_codon:yes stop_codon:yes gene_type:complete